MQSLYLLISTRSRFFRARPFGDQAKSLSPGFEAGRGASDQANTHSELIFNLALGHAREEALDDPPPFDEVGDFSAGQQVRQEEFELFGGRCQLEESRQLLDVKRLFFQRFPRLANIRTGLRPYNYGT